MSHGSPCPNSQKKLFLKIKKNYSININNLVLKPFPDFSLSNSKDFSSIRYYLGDWVN